MDAFDFKAVIRVVLPTKEREQWAHMITIIENNNA